MNNIDYYVLVNKPAVTNNNNSKAIDDVEIKISDTRLPFSEKVVNIYFISKDRNECKKYIKNLDEDIQEHFYIEQVGSEIQYTAFLDILGFSNYIKTKITNDDLAEKFYATFNEVIEYIQLEQQDSYQLENADYLEYIKIKYSWVSDTFVISLSYMNEIPKIEEHIIKSIMLFRLSMIITSIHHFMALKFGFILRGAISSKYSCITNNFILGEGVAEANNLEKEMAIYPRVIFSKSTVNDEVYTLISKHHNDNDLNYIVKDCDGYYFVNYLAMLQYIPPMIGKSPRIPNNEIKINTLEQKINVIQKYQTIVQDNSSQTNEKIQAKYLWLNNYLGRVLLKEEFQKNIIHDIV